MGNNIVFTGFRPTGDLHLGHFFSLISPLSKLFSKHELFLLVADIHSLTEFRKFGDINLSDFSNVIDVNIKNCLKTISYFVPIEDAVVFRQSHLREYHYDLFFKLMMISKFSTTFGNPIFQHTMTDEINNIIEDHKFDKTSSDVIRTALFRDSDVLYGGLGEDKINEIIKLLRFNGIEVTYEAILKFIKKINTRNGVLGFASYPILMASDIILYSPKYVLVGVDQEPHLQITNEIIRIMNNKFNLNIDCIEPIVVSDITIKGSDGNKMSKTLHNFITIDDIINESSTVKDWFMKMKTYPRLKKDPGDPKNCVVGEYYINLDINSNNLASCVNAGIGCVQCKTDLYHEVINLITERLYSNQPVSDAQIRGILSDGKIRAINRIKTSNHLGCMI